MSEATQVLRTLSEIEQEAILEALKACKGNRSATARALKISLKTLQTRLSGYRRAGVEIPDPSEGWAASGMATWKRISAKQEEA